MRRPSSKMSSENNCSEALIEQASAFLKENKEVVLIISILAPGNIKVFMISLTIMFVYTCGLFNIVVASHSDSYVGMAKRQGLSVSLVHYTKPIQRQLDSSFKYTSIPKFNNPVNDAYYKPTMKTIG